MKLITALLAAVLLLSGCGGSDEDTSDPAPQTSAEVKEQQLESATGVAVGIVIENGKVTPQGKRLEVKAGKLVRLTVMSDADEEIHVHSDPEHTFAVKAGEPLTETFTIDTPGQVAIEAHELGVTVVQLVVRK